MQVDEVDSEIHGCGVAEEGGQIREAVGGVRDGDAADLEGRACAAQRAPPRERLHVCLVPLQREVQRHARRQAPEARVRLVEAEQRVRPVVLQREVHVRRPDRRQRRVVVEQQRDEAELRRRVRSHVVVAAVRQREVVVAPRYVPAWRRVVR